jgi:hypothetical protein
VVALVGHRVHRVEQEREREVLWEGKVSARRWSHAAAMGTDGRVRDKDEGM